MDNVRDFSRLPLTSWFPGHMLKAGRQLHNILVLVDVVVELLDARIPETSRNPVLEQTFAAKPCLLVFNKADLADPVMTADWKRHFAARGERCLFIGAQQAAGLGPLLPTIQALWEEERARRGATRPLLRPLRIMICGVPNVGKSTLVNRLAERRKAVVGPKPGVTRNQQWIRLQSGMELLDTPGVLWPRLDSKDQELRLAVTGGIRDEVIGTELMAEYLWCRLRQYPGRVAWDLYGLAECPSSPEEFLDAIASSRGFRQQGGGCDRNSSSVALLNDFRAGKLGRITLDSPRAEVESGPS